MEGRIRDTDPVTLLKGVHMLVVGGNTSIDVRGVGDNVGGSHSRHEMSRQIDFKPVPYSSLLITDHLLMLFISEYQPLKLKLDKTVSLESLLVVCRYVGHRQRCLYVTMQ